MLQDRRRCPRLCAGIENQTSFPKRLAGGEHTPIRNRCIGDVAEILDRRRSVEGGSRRGGRQTDAHGLDERFDTQPAEPCLTSLRVPREAIRSPFRWKTNLEGEEGGCTGSDVTGKRDRSTARRQVVPGRGRKRLPWVAGDCEKVIVAADAVRARGAPGCRPGVDYADRDGESGTGCHPRQTVRLVRDIERVR